jgi:Type IV secretion system pilin
MNKLSLTLPAQDNGSGGITNPALGNTLQSLNGVSFLQTLLPNMIGLAFVIAAVVFFFMLLIGAIQWIASGGDKGALENARGKISSALVGIIVLFSIFAIIKFVESFFGISILALDIGPFIIK